MIIERTRNDARIGIGNRRAIGFPKPKSRIFKLFLPAFFTQKMFGAKFIEDYDLARFFT